MDFYSQLEVLGVVLVAAFLGALIGFERELSHRSAGLRTHILVAASSAVLISLGNALVESYRLTQPYEILRIDPINIIQAIIVGVSFIGGGTIIKDERKNMVENLTTATSILFTAAVGIATALGQIYLALGVSILVVATNYGLFQFEKKVLKTQ